MKYFEKKDQVNQTIFFPGSPLKVNDEEADFYISRLGIAQGNGTYNTTFLINYCWGMIALEGKAVIKFPDQSINISRGDLLLFRSNEECAFEESRQEPFRYLWFDLTGKRSAVIMDEFLEPSEKAYFPGLGNNTLSMMQKLKNAYVDESYTLSQSVISAWTLMDVISRQKKAVVVKDEAHSCRVIIETEFTSSITVAGIADNLGIDRSTLYRKFKKSYGTSPKQYLDRLKVDYARKLLKTTKLSIKEICFESGYDSLQHFYLMYNKFFKKSPAQERQL